jgi:ferric-dicitrate binding protein FerR (iron transport regulator)
MNTREQEPDDRLDPETARLVDAQALPRARAEFATRLRRDFVAGSIAEAPHETPRAEPRPSSFRPARWGWLAAAAAIMLVGLILWRQGSSRGAIELLAATPGDVKVDDGGSTLEGLREGSRVETGEQALDLRVAGVVVIEIGAHSKLRFERIASSRGGDFEFALDSGALRVVTGPDFQPSRLRVRAPDADIAVVGTEFGVDVIDGKGTCVCCTRGEVEVRATHRSDELTRIAADHRSFCFVEPTVPPDLGAAAAEHVAPIVALRRFW